MSIDGNKHIDLSTNEKNPEQYTPSDTGKGFA